MSKFFKFILFLATLAVITACGNFVFAQGKGYFLEKGQEFFIFDDLHIKGYLSTGKDIVDQEARAGDVLVENEFILDEESSLIFCKDNKRATPPFSPLNTDCAEKVLVWHSDPNLGLEVVNPQFFQLTTSNIEASDSIRLLPNNDITTSKKVKVTGCILNDGSQECDTREKGQLKTNTLYLQNLTILSEDNLTVNADNISFKQIDLGPASNLVNQRLCTKQNWACFEGNGGKDFMRSTSFYGTPGWYPLTAGDITGFNVCCYLKVNY